MNTAEQEEKTAWHKVHDETYAMNTATGVLVERQVDCAGRVGEINYRVTATFIPGENWDPDKGEFVEMQFHNAWMLQDHLQKFAQLMEMSSS